MIFNSKTISRILSVLVAGMILTIATAFPAGYFIISYQYLVGSLDSEVELSARNIEKLISNNPQSWQFEEIRLQDLLRRLDHNNIAELHIIRNMQGKIIARVEEPLEIPLLMRSQAIYDSGTQIATIEISRSLSPLITRAATIGAGSVLAGIIIFLLFRIYLLRAVRESYQAMQKSESRLRRGEKVANFGNWEINMDNHIVHASDGARIIYGLEGTEWQLSDVQKLPLPEYRDILNTALTELMEHGRPYNVEFKVRRLTDARIIDIQSFAEYDSSNRIVFGVIHDITAHRKADEEKEKLEAQLLQAQKMELIGQLAGGIAHDFNNILTAISGFGFLLKLQLKESDSGTMYINQILEAAERAAVLTQSLLAFSRKQHSNPQPAALNSIILKTENMLVSMIGEDIQLTLNLTEQNNSVCADSNQVAQILMNLATNARDSMLKGGTVIIGTERAVIDEAYIKMHGYGSIGNYIVMTVTDSGMGMDKQTRQRIFEPFFTTKPVGKGTGLGLSMVYGIVKQHVGFINVYSELGTGTTFKVYLPAFEMIVEDRESPELFAHKGCTETILVVDDDIALRKALTGMLKEFGYTVIEAHDGNDAVTKFRALKDEIHLILMDVIMPNKGGGDAYQEIKAMQPSVKIILTSGYTGDYLSGKMLMEENVQFISKPISPKELFDKIRSVLSNGTA